MSYPEPRYLAEQGAVSSVFRPADAEPDLHSRGGTRGGYLATGASTQGQFGLYRWDMPAEPSGPSPHFHRSITESFFIISGTVRLFNGEKWIDAKEGDFLYVPQGGVHGFRNESGVEASMLILFTPGAPREEYFEELAAGRQFTPEEWSEFCLRHDTFWT
ncbi:cupin domain-containing protein [Allonocardiopsis opalescens]|uniref:Cupin domain-containing protein n=1 Tax=Allonocardiopsis opalescens TaxID=1144618 RepID=A0A2T0Q5A8_9ACTN|nr:cupin domain-containing protein [Allonocardiopsis opalescens]PRX98974.1 Cupin domain-containing protein [Allonocardiopsis opalescens]